MFFYVFRRIHRCFLKLLLFCFFFLYFLHFARHFGCFFIFFLFVFLDKEGKVLLFDQNLFGKKYN